MVVSAPTRFDRDWTPEVVEVLGLHPVWRGFKPLSRGARVPFLNPLLRRCGPGVPIAGWHQRRTRATLLAVTHSLL